MFLKNKLVNTTGIIAIISVIALFAAVQRISSVVNEQIEDGQRRIVNHAFQLVSLYIERARDNLSEIASDQDIIRFLEKSDSVNAQHVSEKMSMLMGILQNIGLHEIVGSKCIARSASKQAISVVGKDFSSRDYCRGAIKTQDVYLSSAFVSVVSGEPVLGLVVPVKNSAGRMLGYVLGIIDVKRLHEHLASLQEGGSFVVLFDRYNVKFLDTREKIEKLTESGENNNTASFIKGKAGFFRQGNDFVSFRKTDSFTLAVGEKEAHLFYRKKILLISIIFIAVFATILLIVLLLTLIKKRTKELTEAKAKLGLILGSIGDAVMACDKSGIIVVFNKAAQELSGFDAKEAIGKHHGGVIKFALEDGRELSDDIVEERLRSGRAVNLNHGMNIICKGGGKIPVSAVASLVKDDGGNVVGRVLVFRNMAKEREIDKMKTEFVSLASHQLRAPLTAISWLTEILKKEETGVLNAKQKNLVQDIYQSVDRMIDLVNDLLNISRLESGTLAVNPELVQLENITMEVIDNEALLIKRRECKVVFKQPKKNLPLIPVDRYLITQVLHNLLINAIRYSKNGCKVEIKLEKRKDDYLLTVSDGGIGIPRDKQPRIFEKFFRADNAQKMHPDGTGLGLYIAKIIMESSGGRIWFDSKLGRGTKFFIAIPLSGMRGQPGGKKLILQ